MSDAAAPVTLITGATRGIGRAISDRLAGAGHRVIGIARSSDPDFPGDLFLADVSDSDALADVLTEIIRRFEVDNLVNNAGFNEVQRLLDIRPADFRRVLDVNLMATLQCAQACVPAMIRKKCGRIVNLGSRALLGRPGTTSYSAAKAGVVAMSRCWALELAEHNITVNVVAPGPIETEMFRRNNPLDNRRPRRSFGASRFAAWAGPRRSLLRRRTFSRTRRRLPPDRPFTYAAG